jgi:hypothetical protein
MKELTLDGTSGHRAAGGDRLDWDRGIGPGRRRRAELLQRRHAKDFSSAPSLPSVSSVEGEAVADPRGGEQGPGPPYGPAPSNTS